MACLFFTVDSLVSIFQLVRNLFFFSRGSWCMFFSVRKIRFRLSMVLQQFRFSCPCLQVFWRLHRPLLHYPGLLSRHVSGGQLSTRLLTFVGIRHGLPPRTPSHFQNNAKIVVICDTLRGEMYWLFASFSIKWSISFFTTVESEHRETVVCFSLGHSRLLLSLVSTALCPLTPNLVSERRQEQLWRLPWRFMMENWHFMARNEQ